MIIAPEMASLFYYLGSIDHTTSVYDNELANLKDKQVYCPEVFKPWVGWVLEYAGQFQMFPPWERFVSQSGMENGFSLSIKEARRVYNSLLATWESDALAHRLISAPVGDRRSILQRLTSVLAPDLQDDTPLDSLDNFSIDGTIVKDNVGEKRWFNFPINHLNDVCIINPGSVIVVMGPPGSLKSTVALNTAYVNSVSGPLNTLYIYLENTVDSYNINLLSRHSWSTGLNIEAASLKRGVHPDDTNAVQQVKALQSRLQTDKKGNIYFVPYSKFNPEPLRFAGQLSEYVNKYKIDFVVLDYLQACNAFTPLRWDRREFLNQTMSDVRQAALGAFGAKPFVAMVLAQPNREAKEKLLKTQGQSLSINDGAEVGRLEEDAFCYIGLYTDAALLSNGQLRYKLLKNRDNCADMSLNETVARPAYSFCGDVMGDDVVQSGVGEISQDLLDGDF